MNSKVPHGYFFLLLLSRTVHSILHMYPKVPVGSLLYIHTYIYIYIYMIFITDKKKVYSTYKIYYPSIHHPIYFEGSNSRGKEQKLTHLIIII